MTAKESSSNYDDLSLPAGFPQPSKEGSKPYRYVRRERMEECIFPGGMEIDALCWVLQSKGKGSGHELFLKAKVVEKCNKEDRILVRYPKGSTYRVRKPNTIPILENEKNLVLVTSETHDYRRTAIVHTLPSDHFLEIGCDYGILVDKVAQLAEAQSSIGVDKSEESIAIAKKSYPNRDFVLGDIFEGDLGINPRKPLVVAIDINGNRELPAVLKCIQLVLDSWTPRLVVVKSRELHAKLVKEAM